MLVLALSGQLVSNPLSELLCQLYLALIAVGPGVESSGTANSVVFAGLAKLLFSFCKCAGEHTIVAEDRVALARFRALPDGPVPPVESVSVRVAEPYRFPDRIVHRLPADCAILLGRPRVHTPAASPQGSERHERDPKRDRSLSGYANGYYLYLSMMAH